jgi:chemotaxis protein methyltransferase CheR
VCRRIARRIAQLDLPDAAAYRARLESDPGEWAALDGCCRVSISRFWRDRDVFEALARELLPELARRAAARRATALRAWSAGCASGEEPYSLVLAWELEARALAPGLELRVVATDADPVLVERARHAVYPPGSLRELPAAWRAEAFEPAEGSLRLATRFRESVELRCEDLRERMPDGAFDLVLCRNLAFTYFDDVLQRTALAGLLERVVAGGALVVGRRERLPEGDWPLAPWPGARGVFRKEDA